MNVVHCITSLGFGGAARGVLELMTALDHIGGFHQRLIVLGNNPGTFDEYPFRPSRPEFFNFTPRNTDVLGMSRTVRRLRRVLDQHSADVLHTHLLDADLLGARACRNTGTKHLSHIRDTLPWVTSSAWRDRLRRRMYCHAFRRADTRFVSVSAAAGEHHQRGFGIPPQHSRVVLNGIDPNRFPDVETGVSDQGDAQLRIGTAGRFAPEKGHLDLIAAVGNLRRRGLNVKLTIAGMGQSQKAYAAAIENLKLQDVCEVIPPIEDMNHFLRRQQVFVLPSRTSEGLARVLIEAMYCGLAIVATDVAGTTEAITHERNGLLAPTGDVTALTAQLERLASSAELRKRLGTAAAVEAQEKFTVSRLARDVASAYEKLVANLWE